MKVYGTIFIFTFFVSIFVYAEYVGRECSVNLVGDKKDDSLFGCDASLIALIVDPDGDKSYRRKLNKNLADLVATQTEQILNDLAASSSFYENENQDFLMGNVSNTVQNSCQFSFVKDLEISGCIALCGLNG